MATTSSSSSATTRRRSSSSPTRSATRLPRSLGSRIRQEDRFDADLEAVLGVLPSYTQLGMAALLPAPHAQALAGWQDRPR
ncbi:MAG: PglZ domain-containing protein [Marmoricola sp.]